MGLPESYHEGRELAVTTDVNWTNPYAERHGTWLRGNLHAHTSPASSCATLPVEVVLDLYADLGYDFLCLSDHMTLTPGA